MSEIKKAWYKEGVVYQIYPQSFQDTNDDGIGDLRGIIERIPYLVHLGVNIIWLSPIYASPMDDNGYDIADYYSINPIYGTMDDFKELIAKLKENGIKLIMDLVVNHTSDEHPWFQAALKDKNSPYRDYYFFRKGKKNKKPNNWTGFFGGTVWEYIPEQDEYYMHLFSKKQVDLNWDNPKVREEVKNILRFWLDLGVAGFRCDVINVISKHPDLPHSKKLSELRGSEYYINGPRVHEYLQELKRDVFSKYDCFTVGESVKVTTDTALEYIAFGKEELNMLFQFEHMSVDTIFLKWFIRKFKPMRLKRAFVKWQNEINGKAWNALYIENHDQPRSASRFCDPRHYQMSVKMLAAFYMLQQGTPFIYQGQEIGMCSPAFPRLSQYRDVESKNIYKIGREKLHFSHKRMMRKLQYMSRDNARTPMQWSPGFQAGFTNGTPWIEVCDDYRLVNVDKQMRTENSILNWYRKLIQLRHEHEVIVYGDFVEDLNNHKQLIYFRRVYNGCILFVMLNYSNKTVAEEVIYPLDKAELILNNYEEDDGYMYPYQVKVYLYNQPDSEIDSLIL